MAHPVGASESKWNMEAQTPDFDIAAINPVTLALLSSHDAQGDFLLNVRNWRCSQGLVWRGLIKDSWNCLNLPPSAR